MKVEQFEYLLLYPVYVYSMSATSVNILSWTCNLIKKWMAWVTI